jgi:hypothetical protein
VAVSQPLPLKLKSFKAQGATGVLTGSPNPYGGEGGTPLSVSYLGVRG